MDPMRLYSNLSNPVQEIDFKHDGTDFVPTLEHKAWEFIGFQAEKPWTDFRGVGLFGLQQLVYFGETYPGLSQNILSYCIDNGQLKCYSYAITGINITMDVINWFRARKANLFYYKYIYNVDNNDNNNGLNAVHLLYCRAYQKFHQVWETDPPETVMGYSKIHKTFMKQTELDFENDDLRLLPRPS